MTRIDIFVSLWDAPDPDALLRSLGITWRERDGQPIADQIKFIDCENVPADLPAAVRHVVRDVREACAKVCDAEAWLWPEQKAVDACNKAAAAIRARGAA